MEQRGNRRGSKSKSTIPNKDEWTSIFTQVFEELDDRAIHQTSHGSFDAEHPLVYTTKGEANYTCKRCNRRWSSINGLVEFEYRLSVSNTDRRFGDVHLVLNGQMCKSPSCKQEFVKPMFVVESINTVLEKLLVKVKQKFYEAENGEDLEKRFNELNLKHKPAGRGNHIPELCEGCKKGLCQSKPTVNPRDFGVPRFYGRTRRNVNLGSDIFVKWELRL